MNREFLNLKVFELYVDEARVSTTSQNPPSRKPKDASVGDRHSLARLMLH